VELATQRYTDFVDAGNGMQDTAAIVNFYSRGK
jgi:hypothetical protein